MDKIDRILKNTGITEYNCMSSRLYRDIQSLLPFFSNKPKILSLLQHRIYNALREGVSIGLKDTSIEHQKVSMNKSARTDKQREYLQKLNDLHREYKMGFRYHPLRGMELFELKDDITYFEY